MSPWICYVSKSGNKESLAWFLNRVDDSRKEWSREDYRCSRQMTMPGKHEVKKTLVQPIPAREVRHEHVFENLFFVGEDLLRPLWLIRFKGSLRRVDDFDFERCCLMALRVKPFETL